MLLNVFYDEEYMDADLLDVSELVINNLDEIVSSFFAWMFNKDNEHQYWLYSDGEKICCEYDSKALVEWINAEPSNCPDKSAMLLKQSYEEIDYKLPHICL